MYKYIYIYSNCKHSQATFLRAMHVSRKCAHRRTRERERERGRGFRSCYPSTGRTLRSLIPPIYFSRHERANIPAVYADSFARTQDGAQAAAFATMRGIEAALYRRFHPWDLDQFLPPRDILIVSGAL